MSTGWIRLSAATLVAAAALATSPAEAQACRSQAIMASQCTWMVLEEVGGSKAAAKRAEQEATSGLIDGCTPGQYQMVLLRGTDVTGTALQAARARGLRSPEAVRAECARQAGRMAAMR